MSQREVLSYLQDHGPASASEIAEALGMDRGTVVNQLSKLRRWPVGCDVVVVRGGKPYHHEALYDHVEGEVV